MRDARDRLRDRLAAEGVVPSAHHEAIDEIADHLDDLHRAAITAGKSSLEADDIGEAELARIGPLAAAVVGRARRGRQTVGARSQSRTAGLGADFHRVRIDRVGTGLDRRVRRTRYYVSQRTREIGVRAALGATRRQLSALVVRQSMLPIAAGVIAGVAGSFATGRLLQEFLYQVQPDDPQVIAIIVALLIGVGLLASWLPARRAAAIDPMVALRDE